MLFVFESGRLGNQIFQYVAMRIASPTGKIVVFGMSELQQLFLCPNIIGFFSQKKSNKINELCIFLFWNVLRVLSRIRLIGVIFERRELHNSGVHVRVRVGILPRVFWVRTGYWQYQGVVDQGAAYIPSLRPQFEEQATRTIAELGIEQNNLYFLHIRRGDYLFWPQKEHPAVLPLWWYKIQMDRIQSVNPSAFFLVFSDDTPYVEDFFTDKERGKIITGDIFSDFSLMTKCQGGGILSASTYAWWAAYISRCSNPNAYFIAPLYWAGHRVGKWFPDGIETDWIDYQPVTYARN